MAVVGAGAIGLELAQALSRMGIEVVLFNDGPRLGGLAAGEVLEVAKKYLAAEFVFENTKIQSIEKTRAGFKIQALRKNWNVGAVLVAAGRKPNLANLDLEKTAVRRDSEGRPLRDPASTRLRGTDIYLAGDASAYRSVLHEANDEGRIAGRNALAAKDLKFKRRTPLAITFTHPQIAVVGMPAEELKKNKIKFVTGTVRFENQGRAKTQLEAAGILKIYGAKKDGRLLGAEMFAPEGEHLAHQLAMAIDLKLDVFRMLSLPFYHPVLEEGLRKALRDLSRQVEQPCSDFDLSRCSDSAAGS